MNEQNEGPMLEFDEDSVDKAKASLDEIVPFANKSFMDLVEEHSDILERMDAMGIPVENRYELQAFAGSGFHCVPPSPPPGEPRILWEYARSTQGFILYAFFSLLGLGRLLNGTEEPNTRIARFTADLYKTADKGIRIAFDGKFLHFDLLDSEN